MVLLDNRLCHFRAMKLNLLTQDMIDDYDPALMFTIPRLAIIWSVWIQIWDNFAVTTNKSRCSFCLLLTSHAKMFVSVVC